MVAGEPRRREPPSWALWAHPSWEQRLWLQGRSPATGGIEKLKEACPSELPEESRRDGYDEERLGRWEVKGEEGAIGDRIPFWAPF